MNYYSEVSDYFNNPTPNAPRGLQYGTVNTFNSINIPYGQNLLPSNAINRQGAPGPGTFGPNNYGGQVIQSLNITAPQNNQAVQQMNRAFFNPQNPSGVPQYVNPDNNYGDTSLQVEQNKAGYSTFQNQIFTERPAQTNNSENNVYAGYGQRQSINYYVGKASESLHQKPDILMTVFFSDDNINHLRNSVVQKVKEITADSGVAGNKEGVTIQTPNMDDFFYYMVNIFQNYKIQNGSICFVNLKNNSNLKADIIKLNTNVLQEYVSKMVSQINMYIYYYKDASQLPDQLSRPTYTAMKGSRTLEYNAAGFEPSNSIGIASYNEVGNIM